MPHEGSERRRATRLAINVDATLRERGRSSFPVRLVDLSALGCRAEIYADVPADSPVWLKLPGLEPRYSRVAWSRSGFAGIEFEAPLHPSVVDILAGIDRVPTEAELAELRRISARCRALAAKLKHETEEDDAARLLALADDCELQADQS